MAFAVNNPILANDFIDLKARVKAECARRCYNGSVAQYATSEYDYTSQPTSGGIPLPQHLNKIIVPLNAIRNTGISETRVGYLVRTYDTAQTILSELEAIEADAENSGCSASCTGLCQGTCTGACTSGCTGGCKAGCTSSCGGECSHSCFINCDYYCTDKCDQLCAYDCEDDCEGTCLGWCYMMCTGGCYGTCASSCRDTCAGNVKYDDPT